MMYFALHGQHIYKKNYSIHTSLYPNTLICDLLVITVDDIDYTNNKQYSAQNSLISLHNQFKFCSVINIMDDSLSSRCGDLIV